MGIATLLREGLYNNSESSKRLANPNRPFYKKSLFLFIVCRSLPEPDPSQFVQIDSLKEVFRSVETTIDHSTLSPNNKLDVKRQFDTANDLLENYIRTYHVGAQFGSYMESNGPLLTITQSATQEDNWAKKTLQEFSKTVDQKVESVKRRDKRTINITVWGASPLKKINDHSNELRLKCVSNLIPDIKIEVAARVDTLLHRVFEYCATTENLNGRKSLRELKSLELDRNPQFYDISPVDIRQFYDMEKIVPIPPWTPISKVLGKMLHLVPTRNSFLESELKFDSFFQEGMHFNYTNAWPFIDQNGKRLGNSLAVRNRTLSHSLSLLSPSEPHRPYSHSIDASSSHTRVDSSTTSSLTVPLKEHFSHAFYPHPDPIIEPALASSEMPEPHTIPFNDRPQEKNPAKEISPCQINNTRETITRTTGPFRLSDPSSLFEDAIVIPVPESFWTHPNDSAATFRVSNHSTSSICTSSSQATDYSYASSRTGNVDYGLYYTRRAYSLETLAESVDSY